MQHTSSVLKGSAGMILLAAGLTFIQSCGRQVNAPSSSLQVSSFTPASAPKDAEIVIHGAGFSTSSSSNIVTVNGKAAVVLSASLNSLTIKVPAGAHDGKITVQVDALTASSAKDFIYLYTVTTLAGSATPGYKEGTGAAAEFNLPFGVAVDAAGNVYVTDDNNNRIRKITPAGVTSTLAGDGMALYKDAIAAEAQFRAPLGIALDLSSNVYIGDTNNKRIRKISTGGMVSTLAGDGTTNFKDATGTEAEFYAPAGVALDAAGNVYVADANNNRIRKITPDGVVTTLAGDGTAGFKDGTGVHAQFHYPTGVALDAAGNVYVADIYNNRIRKITPAGVVTTLAGDGHASFKEGTGAVAEFNSPTGIAADAAGNVYVADTYNYRIRKITPAGVVTTLAGDGTGSFREGTGPLAQFNEPTGIAIDAAGNLYVADNNNYRIRKLE